MVQGGSFMFYVWMLCDVGRDVLARLRRSGGRAGRSGKMVLLAGFGQWIVFGSHKRAVEAAAPRCSTRVWEIRRWSRGSAATEAFLYTKIWLEFTNLAFYMAPLRALMMPGPL